MDTPSGFCEVASPAGLNRACIAARGHRSIKHVDQSGYEWSDGGQLSGDRPRKVMEDRLRRLLAHVEQRAEGVMCIGAGGPECSAYAEIALHLKNILDVP